jgi:hypothetical protein
VAAALGLLPLSAGAQSSVVGTVATDAGVPIPGLPVIVDNGVNQSVAITDQDGNFDAQVPSGDGYRVILPTGDNSMAVPPVGDAPVSVGDIRIAPY